MTETHGDNFKLSWFSSARPECQRQPEEAAFSPLGLTCSSGPRTISGYGQVRLTSFTFIMLISCLPLEMWYVYLQKKIFVDLGGPALYQPGCGRHHRLFDSFG